MMLLQMVHLLARHKILINPHQVHHRMIHSNVMKQMRTMQLSSWIEGTPVSLIILDIGMRGPRLFLILFAIIEGRTIVFTKTKDYCFELSGLLAGPRPLHGDIQQSVREDSDQANS